MASEATPVLPSKSRDKSFPARTRIIGIIDPIAQPQIVYLRRELIQRGVVKNEALNVFLVALGDTVNGFKGSVTGKPVHLAINADNTLSDTHSATVWDARGKYKSGPIQSDLEMLAISDEYWFSWKTFHPSSHLIRLQ